MEQFNNALELAPNYSSALMFLGQTHILMGMYDEGIQALETAAKILGNLPMLQGFLGHAYAQAGRITDAQKLLEELRGLVKKTYVPALNFAMIYLALGEIDKCFDWLDNAIDEREALILQIFVTPFFDPLRSHPRFKALLRKMNLEP